MASFNVKQPLKSGVFDICGPLITLAMNPCPRIGQASRTPHPCPPHQQVKRVAHNLPDMDARGAHSTGWGVMAPLLASR